MNQMMTKFFRKGTVGDWKNYIEGENENRWNEWIKNNLEGTDIKMAFEISNDRGNRSRG